MIYNKKQKAQKGEVKDFGRYAAPPAVIKINKKKHK